MAPSRSHLLASNGSPTISITERKLATKIKHIRLKKRNPELATKIAHMRLKIAPIVHVRTGIPPIEYPANILQVFCLTEAELDSMAQYYSQVTPNEFTFLYPQTMDWEQKFLEAPPSNPHYQAEGVAEETGVRLNAEERLSIKRRKFTKFIGMRGCQTPLWEVEAYMRVVEDRINRSLQAERQRERKERFWGGGLT